ncbi:MAG: hypothetical protein ABIH50_02840, partial [bacterium]
FDHPYLIALAISYFGSAFEEKTIGFYFSQGRDNIIYVTVKVKSLGFRHSPSLCGLFSYGSEFFTLSFNINQKKMELSHIATTLRKAGHGGKALTALYNIARELWVESIHFSVHYFNFNAANFYAHLGFGQPTNTERTDWIVDLNK